MTTESYLIDADAEAYARALRAARTFLDAIATLDPKIADNPTPATRLLGLGSSATQVLFHGLMTAGEGVPGRGKVVLEAFGAGIGACVGQMGQGVAELAAADLAAAYRDGVGRAVLAATTGPTQ